MSKRVQRIVVIGLSNVGDAVLMSPVVQRLHARYPDAVMTLFIGELACAVFEHDPLVHELQCLDDFHGGLGKLRLLLAIRRLRPDVLIDLRSTMLPLCWRPWRAWRYFAPVPSSIRHMRDRHLWRLSRQDPDSSRQDAEPGSLLAISPDEESRVDRMMERWNLRPGKRLVVICPGTRSHIKRWYPDRFAAIADRLIKTMDAEIVFTGEPDEAPIVQEILKSMDHVAHNATSCTTIAQLGSLMQRAELVITNDSASLHIACAMGTPVLALFGPTDPIKYGPTGQGDRAIQRRLFCVPCEAALCRFSHECMRYIPVDEVYQAACRILGAPAAPPVTR